MEIQLKKFDMNMISDTNVVVFIGKRNTGKSFLIRDLLYHKRSFPIATVISATECANGFYGQIIPSIFIHSKFNEDLVGNVLKRQEHVAEQNNARIKKGEQASDDRLVFVMDDMMSAANSWVRSENIASMFCNGRHFKCLFLLSLQYVMGIPPNLRANVDYVFILRENIVKNRKKLYENWAGMFPKFEMFDSVLTQCTEDYECIVIKNNCASNKIEDCVFWYKAKPRPDFRLCLQKWWDLDKKILEEKKQQQSNECNGAPEEDDMCVLSINHALQKESTKYRVRKG